MEMWRKLLLTGLALAAIAGILLTWGSIGSIILAAGLLAGASAAVYQRYLVNNEESDWEDTNG